MTGNLHGIYHARVISSISGMFCSIPAPAPCRQRASRGSRSLCREYRAAPALRSSQLRPSFPYLYHKSEWLQGVLHRLILSFCAVLLTARISASLDTNSVYTMSAPNFLHIRRKAGSVTSSIGASSIGCSPRSIWLIFIIDTSFLRCKRYG